MSEPLNRVPCTVSPEEVARLKGLGFLRDSLTPDCFNGRIITGNGKISAADLQVIAQAANQFGNGEVTMTARLTVEVQKVPYRHVEPMIAFLREHGLETGGTGAKVRPVVSCKGTTCQYGLIDTFALSEKVHEKFYVGYSGVRLPHKFKIAVGGCPNNCLKPDLNDIGIIGQKIPAVDLEKCRGCKVCRVENNCPIKHASVVDQKIRIVKDECNNCGRCDGNCPFGAVGGYQNGYKVYIGGRWGKKCAVGRPLSTVFTEEQDIIDLIEKCILLFKDRGRAGERFADTVNRIGFEKTEKQLLSKSLLERKEEILGKS